MSENGESREIFEYKDGEGRTRKGDPVELLRRLRVLLRGDPNAVSRATKSTDPPTALSASEMLGRAVCEAFRLGPLWDDLKGEGVLESTWRGVFDGFADFLSKKKRPDDSTPTSPTPTEPESSPSPTT